MRLLPMVCVLLFASVSARAVQITSPDGRVVVEVGLKDFGPATACPFYAVQYAGTTVLAPSRLGLDLDSGMLGERMQIISQQQTATDQTWRPVYGERSIIRDHYRQIRLTLQETAGARRKMDLIVRVYDQGAAFCYTLPAQPGMENALIRHERSEFRFSADHPAWAVYSAQGRYAAATISRIRKGCERPLPVRISDSVFAAIGEARLVDYARMKLDPLPGVPDALVSALAGEVRLPLPMTTPWRVIMVGPSEAALLQGNDIILNLNDPCAIADTSWIKPGKVIREATLTTAGGKACVDFAAAHALQYVEFDAGWYGPESSAQSDARAVNLDPKRSRGPLDLQEVIRYGAEHGIGILLYVNHIAAERQLDEILPLYHRWGIKGVKYGFVNVGSQRWTSWLHHAVRKAAENRLMVDIHDEYRPTGYSRTYPNLMTQEGISGDETTPSPAQTLTLQFSRFLCGPADNTICYFDARVAKMGGHAFQLAKAVNLYSPWQFLYWYDRPSGISPTPELAFFNKIPTVWDDTRIIDGRIGQYSVIARRSGDDWYVGCMNADAPRTLNVPLAFLAQGRRYTATLYRDDPSVNTPTHVKVEQATVDSTTVLKVSFDGSAGEAIRIVPE